jgi:hypothetical protein
MTTTRPAAHDTNRICNLVTSRDTGNDWQLANAMASSAIAAAPVALPAIEQAGTSLKAALDILRKYGAAPESLLPFHIATFMVLGDENTFFATTATRRIASYFNLGKNLASWRTWLATHGPILAGVSVDVTGGNATATHGKLDTFKPATVRGGHAIAIVGYTADGRFIVRNSWGDHGFAYASEAYINAAFFNERYGVTI